MTPHFMALEAAYQLHFYLSFKTHYRRPILTSASQQTLVQCVLDQVCLREGYHLLETSVDPDHVRLLLSMKPEQTVSKAVNILKGNVSREFGVTFPAELDQNNMKTLWARGYFARSSGKVNLNRAREYVDSQISHHGYRGDWTKALKYRNPAFTSPAFSLAHSFCILNYHVVLTKQDRIPLFDDASYPGLCDRIV